ncbi:MAG: RraA family protein, partial [Pseudomonadota bacterium]|nr:RraA family protein [Pseudomonadota bacterium]
MALTIHDWTAARLGEKEIAAWREIPTSIIGDELNRAQVMQAAIKPFAPGKGFAGQAITVQCMVGDNLALHHAIATAFKGAVIVGDGRANVETAIWGGIMHTAALHRGVAGVIIDGALRDVAELRESALPIFARAAVP